MRKIRRLLSIILTIVMTVSLLDVTAFGVRLNIHGSSVEVELKQGEEGTLLSASYDTETGRMNHAEVSENGRVSLNDDDAKAMLVDSATYAPKAEAVHACRENGKRVLDFGSGDVCIHGGSEPLDLVGTGTVYLNRVNNSDITLNGVPIGGAHVFRYDRPYGVFLGMDKNDLERVTDFAIYPGRWVEGSDGESGHAEFSESPAATKAVTGEEAEEKRFYYNYNDEGGVNIFASSEDDRDWIDDPYQVKLVLTFTDTNGKTGTVVYDTLWYKEGQMGVADFAAKVREKVGEDWTVVTEQDRDYVTSIWEDEFAYSWQEGEETKSLLDDFAFAVTRGKLQKPAENGASDATHVRNAWDDVCYGTAKTILESVYAAAWNDGEHTALPDSVKLINEQGKEWHGDNDAIPHRELDQMIDALMQVLPQRASSISTITVKRAEDGWNYVLFGDAQDTGENRVDANLRGMRFTQPVTISLGSDRNEGWLSFANCTFESGATINAPSAGGCLVANFNDSCVGRVTIVEAEADSAAREKLVTDELTQDQQSWDTFGRLFYEDAVRIENADKLTLNTGASRVGVRVENGGTVTMDGVEYSSEGKIDLHANYSPDWRYDDEQEKNVLAAYHKSILAIGEDYEHDDHMENGSLTRGLTVSGTTSDEFRIRGIVNAAGLTLEGNAQLYADFDPNNWSGVYVTLGEGQTVYTNEDWGLELFVNGESIHDRRPVAVRDDRDVRIDTPVGFSASVWQWRDEPNGGWYDITNELESHENKDNEDRLVGYTFANQEGGYDQEQNRWYPLNNDSIYGTQVRLAKKSGEKTLYTIVFDPVPCEWERPCNLTDFGFTLRDRLKDNGWKESFTDYYEPFQNNALTSFYTGAMDRLAAVWPETNWQESEGVGVNDLWRGDNYSDRLALALVVDLLLGTEPTGADVAAFAAKYDDPDADIKWGDAKAVLTKVLQELKSDETITDEVFRDGGWRDDSDLNQGGKDDLLEQFQGLMEQVATARELVAALSKGERATVADSLTLSAESLNGLSGAALSGNGTDGYTLTVPTGVELRIERNATLTVGVGVTLALADGSALNRDGKPVDLGLTNSADLDWRINDWGDVYIANNGAELRNDGGKLIIESGGTVRAGRWSSLHNDNGGTAEVFGTLALTGAAARVTGYWGYTDGEAWVNAFRQGDWDDERREDGWIDRNDAAQFHNNGTLRIGTQENATGTMVIGAFANLFNNWDDRGTETDADDVEHTVTVDGTIELAGGIENWGSFTLYSAGRIILNGDSARIINNIDERWKEGEKEPYFVHVGSMDLSAGAIEVAQNASVELERMSSFTLNGLTFTPGEGYAGIRLTRKGIEGAAYELVAEYRGERAMAVSGSDWANLLTLYGNVDASCVTCVDSGSFVNKTAFVNTQADLIALIDGNQINMETGISDVIVVGDIELTSDLTIPACYFEVAEDASLTVGAGVTLTFANGSALDQNGEPVTPNADNLASLAWRQNDDGSCEVANTGSFLQNNGTLTVEGTLALGTYAFLSNNGVMYVNGAMTLADGTFFFEGHKTDGGIEIDGNSDGDGGFVLTDTAGLFNGGEMNVNGTLTGAVNGYIGNGGVLNVGNAGTLTNKGMLAIMGVMNNWGTVCNNALCYVSGQAENEGTWTQSGKLTLEGFGMFGQYDTAMITFADENAVFETIGDAAFYVVVRENDLHDEQTGTIAGLGTIETVSTETLAYIKAHRENNVGNVKTMALVLTADGIASASAAKFNDCILVPQYDSTTVLNSEVKFESFGIEKDVTLTLGSDASLNVDKLLGEGAIVVQNGGQVDYQHKDESIVITTANPAPAAGG